MISVKLSHIPGDGQPSAWMYERKDYYEVEFTRAATPSQPTPGDPTTPTPGNGGGGGDYGTVTLPPVVINPDEVPLVGLESFAAFVNGYPDGTFQGDQNMTKEEFTKILFWLKNPNEYIRPTADPEAPTFDDVAPGRWSYDAIEWAAAADVIDKGGNFNPSAPITRAGVAEMLARADALTEKAENIFSDIENHPAQDYILMGVEAGIFNGYPDGTFRPNSNITRYEVVAAVVRYLLGGVPTDEMWENIVFKLTDVPRTHWAYEYVALATAGYVAIRV